MSGIFKRLSPGANNDNLLQVNKMIGLCCGDARRVIGKKYVVEINTATTPTAKQISLGGAVQALGYAYDLTSVTGVELLIEAIKVKLWELGFGDDGIAYEFNGAVLKLETWWGELSFDWIETTANAFEVSEHQVFGPAKAAGENCQLSAIGEEAGSNFVMNVLSTDRVISVAVKEGANTTRFQDAPTDAGGNIQFASGSFAGSKTFTVIAQTQNCGEITTELTHQF